MLSSSTSTGGAIPIAPRRGNEQPAARLSWLCGYSSRMVRAKLLRVVSVLTLLWLPSCAVPSTISMLDDSAPPPEFGRPAWVRGCAGVGGWLGGIAGGVVSVVLLPITWPLSELAGDELTDHAKDEVIMFPAITFAAGGHAALGMPADLLDYTFRRVWWQLPDPDPIGAFEYMPVEAPQLPEREASEAR